MKHQIFKLKNQTVLFLSCAWMMTNFATHNVQYLEGSLSGFSLIVLVLLVVFIFAVSSLWVLEQIFGAKNAIRLILTACLTIILFFSYQQLMSFWSSFFNATNITVAPHFGYALTFVALPLITLVFCNQEKLRDIILVFLIVVVISSILELLWGATNLLDPESKQVRTTQTDDAEILESEPLIAQKKYVLATNANEVKNFPNIYHIVVDEYARADQLRAILNFDNSAFLSDLDSMGFRVFSSARSNYPYTAFSLSSMLSMDYPYTENDRFTGFISGLMMYWVALILL